MCTRLSWYQIGSMAAVNEAVSASSLALASDMRLGLDSSGQVSQVDSVSLFRGSSFAGTTMPTSDTDVTVKDAITQSLRPEAVDTLAAGWRNLEMGAQVVTAIDSAARGLGVLGTAAVDFLLTVRDANAAMVAGDPAYSQLRLWVGGDGQPNGFVAVSAGYHAP